MPRTINTADRNASAPSAAELSDYALPREKSEGTRALAIWLAIIFVAAGFFAIWEATRQIALVIVVWWLACVLGFFIIAPALIKRRLPTNGELVTGRTQPRLKTLLGKGSALLAMREPPAFVESAGNFRLQMIGRKTATFYVVSKTASQTLGEAEFNLLTIRALIQARENHISRLNLLTFLNQMPAVLRILCWPVGIYANLLRLGWLDAAQQSADRMVLLLKPDAKLLMAAVLKQHLAGDPIMQTQGITNQDVDNFLRQGGVLLLDGGEVSTTYKLGSALHENSALEERIQAITRWFAAPEFAAAAQKLAAGRQKKPVVPHDPLAAQS